ncbi:protein KRI1 homolog isoform X2 [Alligator mississippiensis]|uniref:protein KRI1 homolog isoform X2 n=1 Tax=Alligator mississippiensis TaxID=8496 RepID=UPI002877D82A|nr:protein KRI1 homolog isoform X2 [Alligator mississippiensis]
MSAPALRVNEAFAEHYGQYRRQEELRRLQARYGADAESSSSESDSSGDDVDLDPRQDRDFYRTLGLLKTKDPQIYQADATFYSQEESSSESEEEVPQKRKQKPMYLKDYERKVILEKEGKYEDEEDEKHEEATAQRRKKAASKTYMEEQQEIKQSFRPFVADSEEEEEDEGSSALLRHRPQTTEEKAREENDYITWLKGQTDTPDQHLQDLAPLKAFWSDPALEPGERFLRDYILNQRYNEEDEEDGEEEEGQGPGPPLGLGLADSSDEGELFLQRQDDFERRHNFRFEEPDSQQVRTYPRTIATSVRRKDERRKEKRELRQERKKKERAQRQEELKRLKRLRQQEVAARLAQLQEAAGGAPVPFHPAHLEGDFDSAQHDQLMEAFFGAEFYGVAEEKPQFEEEDGVDDAWNWDDWAGVGGSKGPGGGSSEPHCEDPNFNMDADYDPCTATPTPHLQQAPLMGKQRRKSRLAKALERDKPTFDPRAGTFEQYLDEYYRLDYEDLIGDLPCRFKYRSVMPCDFGLTTEEVLAADDKELNRWCSLRKTCMYRSEKEELQDQAAYSLKAQDPRRKQQILSSLSARQEEAPQLASMLCPNLGKKRQDKLHPPVVPGAEMRPREEEDDAEAVMGLQMPVATNSSTAELKVNKRRHGSRRGFRWGPVRLGRHQFSGQRLQAFGLNPRRLRYRQLLRDKRKGKKPGCPGPAAKA